MRGLKPFRTASNRGGGVASFTDAWIETVLPKWLTYRERSHLLQMRGLKHVPSRVFAIVFGRIFYRCVD